MAKKPSKVEKVSDDYITDKKGIETYETKKKEAGSRVKTKEAIDQVLLKDLAEGNIDSISEHLQALIHDASPDDLVKLKDIFAKHALANYVKTGSIKG